MDEASNMLQSIRQNLRDLERDSDSDGEYDIDDEHRKIEVFIQSWFFKDMTGVTIAPKLF